MVGRFGGSLDQLGDDMRRRGAVGIAHPEIDYVLAGAARGLAQITDYVENVRRQALDSRKIHDDRLLVPSRPRNGGLMRKCYRY
jgi:hypothetical protein